MKISKELSEDYSIIQSIFGDKQITFRLTDTIKQLLAENLKMEFQNEHSDTQRGFPCIRYGNVCLDPRHDFITWDHWLAEADKLLRNGHD